MEGQRSVKDELIQRRAGLCCRHEVSPAGGEVGGRLAFRSHLPSAMAPGCWLGWLGLTVQTVQLQGEQRAQHLGGVPSSWGGGGMRPTEGAGVLHRTHLTVPPWRFTAASL